MWKPWHTRIKLVHQNLRGGLSTTGSSQGNNQNSTKQYFPNIPPYHNAPASRRHIAVSKFIQVKRYSLAMPLLEFSNIALVVSSFHSPIIVSRICYYIAINPANLHNSHHVHMTHTTCTSEQRSSSSVPDLFPCPPLLPCSLCLPP